MSNDQDQTVNRRRLLRRAGTVAAGIAGTAAVGAATAAPAQADQGQPVVQGVTNDSGGSSTTVQNAVASSAALRLANTATGTDPLGNTTAGPALRLAPAGDIISEDAEVGSVSMSQDGTIWAVTGADGDYRFRDYLRTDRNSNSLVPVVPQRVIDTRTAAGRNRIMNPSGNLDSSGRLLAGKTIQVSLEDFVFLGQAVYGNLTVTGPLQAGFVTVFPYPGAVPAASTINFQANQTLSNFFLSGITPLGDWVAIYAQRTTHVILDATAFVVASGQVNPAILPADGELAAQDPRARIARRSKPSWAK
ncbi:hypothetical protein V6U81_24205 [Micromonospora sp. CPCC 205711]|uniref:hypothetical protein n=1 Tax=Micromonospora sp. CPCC 205547 TaxID=3122400 RepID=UPI002FF40412